MSIDKTVAVMCAVAVVAVATVAVAVAVAIVAVADVAAAVVAVAVVAVAVVAVAAVVIVVARQKGAQEDIVVGRSHHLSLCRRRSKQHHAEGGNKSRWTWTAFFIAGTSRILCVCTVHARVFHRSKKAVHTRGNGPMSALKSVAVCSIHLLQRSSYRNHKSVHIHTYGSSRDRKREERGERGERERGERGERGEREEREREEGRWPE